MLIQSSSMTVKTQQGVGLIEVLVAVLILTVGILGLVGLQTRALQFSQESLLQSQAQMLAYEIVDRMRANGNSASAYGVNFGDALSASVNCRTSTCSPTDMARHDLFEWKSSIATALPMGDGAVVRNVGGVRPVYTVSIRFQDTKLNQALSGGTEAAAMRQINVRVEI